MKQLGLGFMQYLQDFDSHYPYGTFLPSNAFGAGWGGQIYPYVKNTQVYQCPDDNTVPVSTANQPGFQVVSYAFNAGIACPLGDGNTGNGTESALTATAKTVMLTETAMTGGNITSSAENSGTIVTAATFGLPDGSLAIGGCWDIVTAHGHNGGLYATGFMGGRGGNNAPALVVNPANVYYEAYNDTDSGKFQNGTGRHLDGSNFLMADGHVKWLKGDAVSTGFSAVTSTSQQGVGARCRQSPITDGQPNQPQAEGTQYTGIDAHAVTFSAR